MDKIENSNEVFTTSFTSLSLILLSFFIYLDAQSSPSEVQKNSVIFSLQQTFASEIKIGIPIIEENQNLKEAMTELLKEGIPVTAGKNIIHIKLNSGGVFSTGSDEILDVSSGKLARISEILQGSKALVNISANTNSNTKLRKPFISQWELSLARAASLKEFFISQGTKPENLNVYASNTNKIDEEILISVEENE